MFAFGNLISKWAKNTTGKTSIKGNLATLFVCIYGGYFNGGLGIVLLALFSTLGMRDINLMNGLKNGMSFALSLASVITFGLAGIIYWPQAILMMVGATIGGYCGAIVARKLSAKVTKSIIVTIGSIMTFIFLFNE